MASVSAKSHNFGKSISLMVERVTPQDAEDYALSFGVFSRKFGPCLTKLFDFFSIFGEGDSGLHKAVQKKQ